ncbi:hypothetical protein ACO0QE_001108 [Hanseniaspora vineae]
MSFRRGRGGASGGFGSTLPFGLNYSDIGVINNEDTELPQIPFPVNGLMSTHDKETGVHYLNVINLVRNGPFYTGDIQPESEIEKLAKDDGIERYSDRFSKKKKLMKDDKIVASIDEHPYQLELFPQELYPMLKVSKKKIMQLSKLKSKDDIFMGTKLGSSGKDGKNGKDIDLEEAFLSIAENLDEGKEGEAGEDAEEAELDDEFDDEDDEDMDDDYNGEKYFDNGEDDDYGDEDNGDEPAF